MVTMTLQTLNRAVVLLALMAVLVTAAWAQSGPVVTRVRLPLGHTVQVPGSEPVRLEGRLDIRFHVAVRRGGGFRVEGQVDGTHVIGTGTISRVSHQGRGSDAFVVGTEEDGVFGESVELLLIVQGHAPDLKMRATIQGTADADGRVQARIENVRLQFDTE